MDGAAGSRRHRPRVSLELHFEPEPDVAGLVVEAIGTEERIVERVQRPLLLGEGVLPVAVAERLSDPPQGFAVERLAPVLAARPQIDRLVIRFERARNIRLTGQLRVLRAEDLGAVVGVHHVARLREQRNDVLEVEQVADVGERRHVGAAEAHTLRDPHIDVFGPRHRRIVQWLDRPAPQPERQPRRRLAVALLSLSGGRQPAPAPPPPRACANAPTLRRMLPTVVPFLKSDGNASAIAPTRLWVRSSLVRCAASGGATRSPDNPETSRANVLRYENGSEPVFFDTWNVYADAIVKNDVTRQSNLVSMPRALPKSRFVSTLTLSVSVGLCGSTYGRIRAAKSDSLSLLYAATSSTMSLLNECRTPNSNRIVLPKSRSRPNTSFELVNDRSLLMPVSSVVNSGVCT